VAKRKRKLKKLKNLMAATRKKGEPTIVKIGDTEYADITMEPQGTPNSANDNPEEVYNGSEES
tara:strand:- start:543 stop:731 length:189 start_codon:yes stop_codon:yes gene_type:complete